MLALTSGDFRPYVFPLFTPAGFAVTSESPADHPHHHSVWIGADHAHALVPASEGTTEEYTYNFYSNEVFQGRAPGRVVETSASFSAEGDDGSAVPALEWRGPAEWAAPRAGYISPRRAPCASRVVHEPRCCTSVPGSSPATWAVRLGPTRHAFLMPGRGIDAGRPGRADARHRGLAIGATQTPAAEWIDYVGPVGGGHEAGVALMPLPTGRRLVVRLRLGRDHLGPVPPPRARTRHWATRWCRRRCVVAHDGDVGGGAVARRCGRRSKPKRNRNEMVTLR